MKFNYLLALAAVAALGFTACDSKTASDAKAEIEKKGDAPAAPAPEAPKAP